ncbi:hypothetical protein GCM10023195_17120 [Actinoallomurus liliacearum]|uniref:Beta-lactamase-related domain-containing protein n=1 Tax=Actinoallomurus liliacearum TaxID=1080073 RepID=A0ABP8TF81_9ACTN
MGRRGLGLALRLGRHGRRRVGRRPVTLENLLTHTAGFDDDIVGAAEADPADIESLGRNLAERQPARVRPPGTVVSYDNYGTALAGYLVEVASGKPFARYVDEHVLRPLGMTATTFAQPHPAAIEAARPGQARPTLRETGDLVRGGLQVRATRAVAAAAGTGWRDACAVAGVLIPLIMSLNAVRLAIEWRSLDWSAFPFTRAHPDWSAWAIWPLVAVLALWGARRSAGVTAVAAVAWWAVIVGNQYLRYDATAAVMAIWWPLLGVVAVGGLAVRPGPRHGVGVLRRNKTLLAAAGILLATGMIVELLPDVIPDLAFSALRDTTVRSAAVVAGVLALSSPVGRRSIVLISPPAAAFLLLQQAGDGGPWSNYPLTDLLLIVPMSCAVFIAGALFLGPAERILRLVRRGG